MSEQFPPPAPKPHQTALVPLFEASLWLADCFGDEILEWITNDAMTRRLVERHYCGGWAAFLKECT